MPKLLCNALKLTSALLTVTLLLPNRTLAESTPAPDSLEQVTSVSQLSDIETTSWAFQALQSLVERYGCIAGYPNGTYRGNRAMTRYEFAAGLNACLDRVQELISTSTSDLVTKEDLAKLQRLQEEFSAELVTLRGRVDTLEASNAELEANQFSTTTKLNGDVIFVVADVFGGDRAVPSSATTAGGATPGAGSAGKLNVNPTLSYRVRLNFDTSFTGKDLLRTRLIAANNTPLDTNVTGTNMTRLGFDANTNSGVGLSRLWYRFPLGKNGSAKIALVDTYFEDNVFTFNPLLSPSISGSVSRFGRFNPIYRQGVNNADESTGGAGFTVNYNLNKVLGLSVGYLAPSSSAGNPLPGLGLFNGSYAAIGQLSLRPSDAVNIGLTYVHAYNNPVNGISVSGDTGSVFANRPFGDVATSTNQYAVEALFRLNPKINISGWTGWTYATAEVSNNQGVSRGDRAHIFNYAVALSFPDLGKAGNLGAIIFGQPPRVTSNDFGNGLERTDRDISYHLEALFRYRLNDNIDITPAVIAVFNPEHNNNNDTEFVGAVRTSFRF